MSRLFVTDIFDMQSTEQAFDNAFHVEEANITYGVYDIAVKVRADSMDALKDLISNQLRLIKKVRTTLSLILIEE